MGRRAAWTVTVRGRGAVGRHSFESLEEAVRAVEDAARESERTPDRRAVDLRYRRFEPEQLVARRVELKGPGVRAGVDVRGDGSVTAWRGRISKTPVEAVGRETVYAALRRELGASG